jgi:hypothetical protein
MSKRIVRILTLCVCAVFVFGAANTLADPIIFYDDFHTMDWTPVNPEDCPDFAVDIESPGYLYMVEHVLTCGAEDKMMYYEMPLCRPIGIMEDLTVSFKIQALDDVYGGMSSVILFGLNDNDERVFYMQWGDGQNAAGYGFLKYFVEDIGTIYFDGYNSPNRPTVNDVMELRRSGNRWTAWLGDTQMGPTLIHDPTRECTKLQVSFWNVPDFTTRNDAKIDYVAVHTASGGDANGDGTTNVGDAVYLISWIFKSGPSPVEPDNAGCPK